MLPGAALSLAWFIDRLFGEPRSAWHPVAWFGAIASRASHAIHQRSAALAFTAGALLWCALVGTIAAMAFGLERGLHDAPGWLALPLLALALKPTFAWKMLRDEVCAVEDALAGGLEAARTRLAGLCSRDVGQLDVGAVRETAIETLAENLNDSLVAPLFWFVVAGLPGAWAWRASNTLDAMWGYRDHREWVGKWAARADDVLGFVPARLTALLLWRPPVGLARLRREALRTPSPNGGWPMATMALRLGVRLGKPGVFTLNAAAPAPDATALRRALLAADEAAGSAFLLAIAAMICTTAAWPVLGRVIW